MRQWLDQPEQYNALRQLYRQHRLSCDPHQLIDAVLG
jgi:hypothetical protein